MGRPVGSRNKIGPGNSAYGGLMKEVLTNPPEIADRRSTPRYDLILCIRAFRDGRFKGLWELSRVDNDGKRFIIVDATSRQSVVNMVNRQIMKMVIAS